MKMKKALLAGLAMTTAAHADPIFTPLTFLLFAGPLGAIASPGVIYAGLQLATAVGAAMLSSGIVGRRQPQAGRRYVEVGAPYRRSQFATPSLVNYQFNR